MDGQEELTYEEAIYEEGFYDGMLYQQDIGAAATPLDGFMSGDALGVFFAVYIGFLIVLAVMGLVMYILYGIAMSTIARNEGYDKPWLAWIPIANYFMIPIMTEYAVHERLKGRFTKTVVIAYIVTTVLAFGIGFALPFVSESSGITVGLLLVLIPVSLTPAILLAYGLYFIYDAYSKRPGLNIAVSILTSGWAVPFQLFRMRNRESLY